jgi:hypothetical protein
MATLITTGIEATATAAAAPDRAAIAIELPSPTAWPLILAAGFTLIFAGLLTHAAVSLLGAMLTVAGCVGWFREVLPHQHEQILHVAPDDLRVSTTRRIVERLPMDTDQARAWLPVHTYPISAGIKGGLAGGVAMAVLACAYGVLYAGSVWYPINLLAAVIYADEIRLVPEQLGAFHAGSFAIACGLHALGSTLVGVLFGAMLPMVPRRPILLGGLIAPLFWTGLLYTIIGLLNPLLERRIDWRWFMASQVAFGVVAGLVVVRQSRMPTRENVSFALRAGVEAPGIMPPHARGEERP